jgi:uncharacterized membrane protein
MATRSFGTGKRVLLASAVAGLLAATTLASPAQAAEAEGDEVKCYGINKCKGTGECGGKGHSCAGQNACKGQGWIKLSKDKCLKIQGGRLTEGEK